MRKFIAIACLFLLGAAAKPAIAPYPSAPECATHNATRFHRLWDYARGCHYDHEHGDSPFKPEVYAEFPGFDLDALFALGHHPTSPAENTSKHGGMKINVALNVPCVAGFEGAAYCVRSSIILYHAFGPYSVEMESRVHSTVALLKVCNPANVSDCGYLYTVGHQDYGQRVTPYQGYVLAYPDTPQPSYGGGFGPYFTTDCFGTGLVGCRPSLAYVRDRNINANSIWTSKPTGSGVRPASSGLFRLLFRVRDTYQLLDSADRVYPFTFRFICGGAVYNPTGCRYNNSTTRVHEAGGTVPAAWDGASWDTDPRTGRVTGVGEVGGLPFQAVGMFTGKYGSELTAFKVSNPTPASNPERDVYFCGGAVCVETSPGAVPSGWIGPAN